jgi:arsenate reductase
MHMKTTLYGIPNCDQVKKARVWLDANGIAHQFHDVKKAGIERAMIDAWLRDIAWETLLNRKGTTWRKLSDERKATITDADSAARLMLEMPSIIKRPVLSTGDAANIHVGFSEADYLRIFK